MNYSDLKKFFDSKIDASTLEKLIHNEVIEYKHGLLTKRYGPVTINYVEGEYMTVGLFHFKKVCNAYLDGFIEDYEMFYIVDAIQLCEHFEFENEEIADLFSLITDPEINGEIDKQVVNQLLANLK
jgi:hypothetical protein